MTYFRSMSLNYWKGQPIAKRKILDKTLIRLVLTKDIYLDLNQRFLKIGTTHVEAEEGVDRIELRCV